MGSFHAVWRQRRTAMVAVVLVGWLMAFWWPGDGLTRWSYDILQLLLPPNATNAPVIIRMDEQAMQDYGQRPGQWKRSLHADLLHRLTMDGPRVVVFDVVFSQPSEAEADRALTRAIRENGRVVLAGDRVKASGKGYTIVPPMEQFETNAAGWGTAKVVPDADLVVRRYDEGNDQVAGLAWAAARLAGAKVTESPERRLGEERWLNYYGSSRPFRATSMSYSNATTRPTGFYQDKSVFIGGQPETLNRGDITDVFGTPFTFWTGRFMPGVDITAVAFANLMNEDWLRRPSGWTEAGLLLLTGILLGGLGPGTRPRTALAISLIGFFVLAVGSVVVAAYFHLWFCWAAVGAGQIPCALIFRWQERRSGRGETPEKATVLSGRLEGELPPTKVPPQGGPAISDHTLLRCIGEGAYGQVWIARNTIGIYHAVKVIYRGRFGNDAPYDRAFRGIQKFMPISRSHEGFIHVLHVGRNDETGLFYYIMEAGDDQGSGQAIEPEAYTPKSLATDLRQRGVVPAREGLELLLNLTGALESLHQHQLIHRDIKPANIIYVNGRPKLADIDLVTDLSPRGDVSRIGTEGYMAPEGPGTAAADVFSLGRVLYVALTGKAPEQCPEFPTRLTGEYTEPLFLELHRVCAKACDIDLARRYPAAARMREDLLDIARRHSKTA
jgi:CHASE2 domain-containing sensor protein